jgi:glycosyltransferase involved in cell wall biosynthesis
MSASRDVIRVALPCTGLGRQHRGFEAFTREVHAALRGAPGIDLRVFGGGGALEADERAVWNLPRTSAAARAVARATHWDPYFVEQVTFFAAFVPRLIAWRPSLIYFADLNFGNACWHWRRRTGQSFRMLYYNGGPTTQPFTRCDFVQQMTPAHHASAVARGESPERMFVLPHGFTMSAAPTPRDPARIASVRRELGVPEGKAMLLSVGMLGPTLKRMDALVEAVAAMGDARPHLVLLGQETPETPALRERARVLGRTVWMGTWPRERMADAYAAADAFALLSLEEGFGLAYVEAMQAGLPVIAQDNANTRYILGDHAVLGDTTTAERTAALIRRALQEDTTDALRRVRHGWVRDRFAWEVLAPHYEEMLRACAAGRRPAWSDA